MVVLRADAPRSSVAPPQMGPAGTSTSVATTLTDQAAEDGPPSDPGTDRLGDRQAHAGVADIGPATDAAASGCEGAIAHEEPKPSGAFAEVHDEVAGLLGRPRPVGMGGHAQHVQVAVADSSPNSTESAAA